MNRNFLVAAIVLFAVLTILGMTIAPSWFDTAAIEPSSFGACLAQKNAVLYYSPTCHWCLQEITELGTAYEMIDKVDCSKNDCSNLSGVPTWEIEGIKYPGYLTMAGLQNLTGCKQ